MHCNQHTLACPCTFEGKGLHTGLQARMTVLPAPAGTGIRFHRTDLGPDAFVDAVAENVSNTARSTSLTAGETTVVTVEHLLSALTGMGIDNALVEIDNVEVPILDGSARYYVEAFSKEEPVDQGVPRTLFELPEAVEVRDEKSGSWIRIEPAAEPTMDVTVDFNSRVLGVQTAHWDAGTNYAEEIGVCRTFVFFHEIEFLFKNNLIKGGDVDNAIVIVEHPVAQQQLDELSRLFGHRELKIVGNGYLNNLKLHFDNECGRHKLLDLIGDMRLSGGLVNARITAYKPGHTLNTQAARAVRQLLK